MHRDEQNQTIRVLIADDHPVVRRGLRSMLETTQDISVVGEAENGRETLQMGKRLKPDVILLDIRMPDVSGLEVARQLRRESPGTKIIILTTYERDGYFQNALQTGVNAYIIKDTAHRDLIQAIRDVHQGQRILSPSFIDKLWQQSRDKDMEGALLNDEEIMLLEQLVDGATNAQIAEQHFWSEATVRRKLQDIYRKLGVKRRIEAVAKAVREGYV